METKESVLKKYGWLSAKRVKPDNNRTVVCLIYSEFQEMFLLRFGYYENKEWNILEEETTGADEKVKYWLPIPYWC